MSSFTLLVLCDTSMPKAVKGLGIESNSILQMEGAAAAERLLNLMLL